MIQFIIRYIDRYYKPSVCNELLISGTGKTLLLDALESILVILGAIVLYP
ncbi:hypothetical protein CN988_16610 [Bacillus thuringiensis]|nr:hypothetical protein COM78_20735 [Bacillus thuringiensis]PER49747.1 hypothetical protein CN486_29020 [Bacillus thuringiensis]PES49902.1 hypothetical protein CN499_13570 [Bacillus thuringiensis]PEV59678.1 hypothetical protein CN434_30715 [Bacillus thuringiensis]PFB95134.1 hypothetical protein CN302_22480 [Bacillus thuringiensis]